jgi:hypothetical protein
MNLLERLDRLVYATRIDRIIFMKTSPRNLRWTPVAVFAALVLGYTLMTKAQPVLLRDYLIGWLIFYGAVIAAGFVRVFGPRFTGSLFHPLDERELMIKARACDVRDRAHHRGHARLFLYDERRRAVALAPAVMVGLVQSGLWHTGERSFAAHADRKLASTALGFDRRLIRTTIWRTIAIGRYGICISARPCAQTCLIDSLTTPGAQSTAALVYRPNR